METLRTAFDCPVGYSDHTEGITVGIAATALGAALYEKHVTLKGGKSPDHDFALEMETFVTLVRAIRHCEKALGSMLKTVQPSEQVHLLRGRRSIFVVRDVKEGEAFTRDNLAVLRPGTGISPSRFEEILGRRSTRSIKAVDLLRESDWH
jgi:sialic acid synthase SpsE